MENTGWVKIYRQIYKNPRSNDPDWLAVWVYLLCHVAWEPTDVIFGGKRITLKPGQFITGRKKVASASGVHESKVERILSCLESEHQIEQRTDRQSRLISINNWSQYQQSEQPIEQRVNNDRTTSEQRVDTNKEYKEYKEGKEERGEKNSPTPSENMRNFLKSVESKDSAYQNLVSQISLRWKMSAEIISREIDKFSDYWSELNKSGSKQRWETEKTFEVQKRLGTWFYNASKYQHPKTTTGPTIIR